MSGDYLPKLKEDADFILADVIKADKETIKKGLNENSSKDKESGQPHSELREALDRKIERDSGLSPDLPVKDNP